MLFFALLAAILTGAIALTHRNADWPQRMRLAMAIALLAVGSDHWINPGRYLPMMPPWIPLHLELVLFTGAAEIAGATGLLWARTRRLAGVALGIYFVAVFPANIHNALNGLAVDGLPQAAWYYWARLPFQPLAIWWALFSAGLIRWPLRARVPS
ncbi:MAG: DoxX family protein [Betaproteobacteria bacterium]